MTEHTIERAVWVPHPVAMIFAFFAAAENLELMTPPELGFQIRSEIPVAMRPGTLIDYRIRLHGIPMNWRTEITRWDPPNSFEDVQLRGPYAKWVHTHTFVEERGGTKVGDRVIYALPFGPLGAIAHPFVRRQLERIFKYRESVLLREFSY